MNSADSSRHRYADARALSERGVALGTQRTVSEVCGQEPWPPRMEPPSPLGWLVIAAFLLTFWCGVGWLIQRFIG
jgi:hypothetical protein